MSVTTDQNVMMRPLRRLLYSVIPVLIATALSFGALGARCVTKGDIGLEVVLPGDLEDPSAVEWVEVGVYQDRCPEVAQLLGGINPEGPVTRIAFGRSDNRTPSVGDLKKGTYGFAAAARDKECGVVAIGCTRTDVANASNVTISLTTVKGDPLGKCGSGSTCSLARCVPDRNAADPSVGAGCSMQLLGAGPFPPPVRDEGVLVTPPVVVPTPSGFLIGYREFIPGAARVTLLPIDASGGANPPSVTVLERCDTVREGDGIGGFFFDGAQQSAPGAIALTRTACATLGPTIDILRFDELGAIPEGSGIGQNGTQPLQHQLAFGRTMTRGLKGEDLYLATSVGSQVYVATISKLGLAKSARTALVGTGNAKAWIGSSKNAATLLTSIQSAPSTDGGVEGGTAIPGAEEIHVYYWEADPAKDSVLNQATSPFSGSWASVAMQGKRAIIVTNSDTPSKPVAYRLFDGPAKLSPPVGISVNGTGEVSYADVAFQQDRMFVAVEQPGSITVNVFDRASTQPQQLQQVFLPANPRIPAMKTLRDGLVAVAATDSRVVVAWSTAFELTQHDVAGGYAVFACSP